jgi:serine/threonine protein kinase
MRVRSRSDERQGIQGIGLSWLPPSNILVAPYDDKPVPKVIDFGLAKAMHQSLTERTLHTAHETVLGTPLYMSPEQAQLNNLDVDTRSDIIRWACCSTNC